MLPTAPPRTAPRKTTGDRAWQLTLLLTCVLVPLSGVAGCGGGGGGPDGSAADASGGDGSCPTFAQVTIWPLCTPCHATTRTGAERNEAPVGVDYDVYARAFANAELGQAFVFVNVMPPPPDPPATPAQKASLNAWISCGKPP